MFKVFELNADKRLNASLRQPSADYNPHTYMFFTNFTDTPGI